MKKKFFSQPPTFVWGGIRNFFWREIFRKFFEKFFFRILFQISKCTPRAIKSMHSKVWYHCWVAQYNDLLLWHKILNFPTFSCCISYFIGWKWGNLNFSVIIYPILIFSKLTSSACWTSRCLCSQNIYSIAIKPIKGYERIIWKF